MIRPRSVVPLCAVFLLLSGCATTNSYKEPLEKFSTAVTQTKTAVALISEDANKARVNNAALKAAAESQRFGLNDMEDVVPKKYIEIRVQGIELIEVLSARLLNVIEDEEGIKAAQEVKRAGSNAEALAKELDGSKVARYAEPVGRLAGTVIRIYDERKRESILRQGISEGLPSAKRIVELLKNDFRPESETDIQGVLKDELEAVLQNRINLYDLMLESQQQFSDSEKKEPELIMQRLEAIEEIIAARNAFAALDSRLLIETLEQLDGTLDQLKVLVDSNRKPETFTDFLKQVNEFARSSAALLRSVNAVKDGGERGRDGRRDGDD